MIWQCPNRHMPRTLTFMIQVPRIRSFTREYPRPTLVVVMRFHTRTRMFIGVPEYWFPSDRLDFAAKMLTLSRVHVSEQVFLTTVRLSVIVLIRDGVDGGKWTLMGSMTLVMVVFMSAINWGVGSRWNCLSCTEIWLVMVLIL